MKSIAKWIIYDTLQPVSLNMSMIYKTMLDFQLQLQKKRFSFKIHCNDLECSTACKEPRNNDT